VLSFTEAGNCKVQDTHVIPHSLQINAEIDEQSQSTTRERKIVHRYLFDSPSIGITEAAAEEQILSSRSDSTLQNWTWPKHFTSTSDSTDFHGCRNFAIIYLKQEHLMVRIEQLIILFTSELMRRKMAISRYEEGHGN